jgi:hypothetical protein
MVQRFAGAILKQAKDAPNAISAVGAMTWNEFASAYGFLEEITVNPRPRWNDVPTMQWY